MSLRDKIIRGLDKTVEVVQISAPHVKKTIATAAYLASKHSLETGRAYESEERYNRTVKMIKNYENKYGKK